ncbi:hypothetical protein Efla_004368 [Eimeria flavescens]
MLNQVRGLLVSNSETQLTCFYGLTLLLGLKSFCAFELDFVGVDSPLSAAVIAPWGSAITFLQRLARANISLYEIERPFLLLRCGGRPTDLREEGRFQLFPRVWMMRWLAAVCLGLAYILSVSAASKEIASAGSNGRYQADEGAARIRIDAPPSVQPAGGLLRAQSQLINSNERRNQHGHLAKQPQAVLTGHAPTAGIPGLGGTDALETQEDGIQSASSQLSLSQETAPKAHNSSARQAGYNYSFSFVEKSESSVAILVLVGTCVILCLIVAGILTYYALSMQAHARKGEERDSKQPYGWFQAVLG